MEERLEVEGAGSGGLDDHEDFIFAEVRRCGDGGSLFLNARTVSAVTPAKRATAISTSWDEMFSPRRRRRSEVRSKK